MTAWSQYLTTVYLPCRQCIYSPALVAETVSPLILGVSLFFPLGQEGQVEALKFLICTYLVNLCSRNKGSSPPPSFRGRSGSHSTFRTKELASFRQHGTDSAQKHPPVASRHWPRTAQCAASAPNHRPYWECNNLGLVTSQFCASVSSSVNFIGLL